MFKIIILKNYDTMYTGIKTEKELCKTYDNFLEYILKKSEYDYHSFKISNTMMYRDGDFFVPKPIIMSDRMLNLSMGDRKILRNMEYINICDIKGFMRGEFDYSKTKNIRFGKYNAEENCLVLDEGVSVYFLINTENEELISDYMNRALNCRTEGAPPCNFYVEKKIQEYLESEETMDGVSILLNDIDTKSFSKVKLKKLLENLYYTSEYSNETKSLHIKAGACYVGGIDSWVKEKYVLLKI